MESVAQINPYERMLSWNPLSSPLKRRKPKKKKTGKNPESTFNTLASIAHETHQRLVEKGSPLRLCVYQQEQEVYMDVVSMDKSKKINQIFTRPIGKDNLKSLIKRLHHQRGLVLDYSV